MNGKMMGSPPLKSTADPEMLDALHKASEAARKKQRTPSFQPNDIIRLKGTSETFRVLQVRPDGTLDVWGGEGGCRSVYKTQGRASLRTLRPETVRLATPKEIRAKA